MTPKKKTYRLAAGLLANLAATAALSAQTAVSWDAGGGATTTTSTAANWNPDGVPAFGSGVQATMTTGGSATADNALIFGPTSSAPALQFGGNFNLGQTAGLGSLTLFATNTGGTVVLRTNSGASAVTITPQVLVRTTSPSAAPRGALLTLHVNNTTATNTALTLSGGIALAPGSGSATYDLRYGGAAITTSQATTRIAGPITGLGTLTTLQSGTALWNGDLVIAGSQSGTSGSNILTAAGTSGISGTKARLVLGESSSDVQSWNNVTLNNPLNVAIGGVVSVNAVTGTTTAGKFTGTGASGATLKINSGTLNGTNIVVGGADVGQNTLDLVKQNSGTLTISGTHTYTGSTTVTGGTLTLGATASLATSGIEVSGGTLNNSATLSTPVTLSGGVLAGETPIGALTLGAGVSTITFDAATSDALTTPSVTVNPGAQVFLAASGSTTTGTPYTVLTNTGGFTAGIPTAFTPATRGSLSLAASNTQLILTPTAPASMVWVGNDATNPTFWDTVTTINWTNGGTPERFYSGDSATFDDTAIGSTVAVQTAGTAIGGLTFNNTSRNFTITGGPLSGAAAITKSGAGSVSLANALSTTGGLQVDAGTLTLSGTNTFTGPLAINGGTLSIGTFAQIGGSASTRAVELNGGTLSVTGATSTSDATPITLVGGDSTINTTGTTTNADLSIGYNTIRFGAPISGSGNLVKTGASVLALGRNAVTSSFSTFTGSVTVNGGVLDIRNNDVLGATTTGTTINSANLTLFPFGQNAGVTFDAEPLTFTGTSYIRSQNEDIDSDILNTLTGPITLADNASLGLCAQRATTASGGVVTLISSNISRLVLSGPISTGTGSTLALGSSNPTYVSALFANAVGNFHDIELSGALTGGASVVTSGPAGSVYTLQQPGYSGNTTVGAGTTLNLWANNTANDASAISIASGATLRLDFVGQDTVGSLTIAGVAQPAGVYSSSHPSGAITGPGTLKVGSLYDSWASSFGLAGADALVDADPDYDGLSNVFEYATGTSPVAAGGTAGVLVENVSGTLRLTYTRIADPALTYTVEGSSNLQGAWSTITAVAAPNPSTGASNVAGPVVVNDTTAVAPGAPRFLRLRVELAP